MEMPIAIMVTLFVVIIVGSVLLVFSRQMIDKARVDIANTNPKTGTSDDQTNIQLSTIDNQQLADLMLECYNEHHSKTLEKTLCFAVIGKQGSWTKAGVSSYISANSQFKGKITYQSVNDNDYAMSIYFDPIGAAEQIVVSR